MLAGIMLSVIIPTLNAAESLPATLDCIGNDEGIQGPRELIIADGGSLDDTLSQAERAGASTITSERGRGTQLAAGAAAASGDWLLFVHADTILQPGWGQAVSAFIEQQTGASEDTRAAVFRFRLDDTSLKARCLEAIVSFRTRVLGLPYGDQCLLISRAHYDAVSGFQPIPIMEDVDIIRRIGWRNFSVINHDAVTSARRYHQDGYLRRMMRNIVCLTLWFVGVAPDRITRVYR